MDVRIIWAYVAVLSLACWAACPCRSGEDAAPPDRKPPRDCDLTAYSLVSGPKVIEHVRDNASGLAFSPKTRTLLVVLDGPPTVVELGLDGATRRLIPLRGFSDTEGIAHVRDDTFAVAEEGRRTLVLVQIGPQTEEVDRATCPTMLLDPKTGGNSGLEGVAYDPKGRRFFGVKEKWPRKIYQVAEPTPEVPAPEVKHPWDIEKKHLDMKDLADVYFEPQSGHLLILSEESGCLVECTAEGKEVSRMSLQSGESGLKSRPPKPEGVAMDDEGNLYVCSEPNLLYVFARRTD